MSGPNGEGPLPPESPTENVSVRFPRDELDAIDRQAEQELRNRSQMIRVLVVRGLTVSQRADKDTP